MISAELQGLALTGPANDAEQRQELAAYALNRPTRTQDAVITMAGHLPARGLKKAVSESLRPI